MSLPDPSTTSKQTRSSALAEISFDDQDRALFSVEDVRLRADALRYSVLPRLMRVLRESWALIREIYGVDVFDDSIVSFGPQFRPKRSRELTLRYECAYAGLNGQRTKDKWHGLQRVDGRETQIMPFVYNFRLDDQGMLMQLHYSMEKFADSSFRAAFQFLVENVDVIQGLCFVGEFYPRVYYGGSLRPLSPLNAQMNYMMLNCKEDGHGFFSRETVYPIGAAKLVSLARNYAILFPVYDSLVQIAKGLSTRFDELIAKLNSWLEIDEDEQVEATDFPPSVDPSLVAEAAKIRVPVMPSIRWRVFQRDRWRCVACGRGALDDTILHVDHITPRSMGGPDRFENYQTLCSVCNLGKSNRDGTDLRREPSLL